MVVRMLPPPSTVDGLIRLPEEWPPRQAQFKLSPALSNCGLADTSSRTVTPYLLAMDSKRSPLQHVMVFGFSIDDIRARKFI